jgi:sugar lactone lactonase YvrE
MRIWSLLLFLLLLVSLPGLGLAGELEIIAETDKAPGNITVTPDGRIILSLHQFFSPDLRVVELSDKGELSPFPNEEWNRPADDPEDHLDSVLGIQSDDRGVVWMLDNGMRSDIMPKIVGWDTRGDSLYQLIPLPPPATHSNSFVNDLAVDRMREKIFIADPAGGENAALIVVDLKDGRLRRILEGHASVTPEPVDLVIDDRPIQRKLADGSLVRPHVGVNPIALDALGYWLYFGPMHGRSMYRVRTTDLCNEEMDPTVLASRVERYADKPICDGITIDKRGNIYLGDLANDAIGVITPKRRYQLIHQNDRLSWVDAFSIGPVGKVYTVANQLHRSAVLNAGEDAVVGPFPVCRFDPYSEGAKRE